MICPYCGSTMDSEKDVCEVCGRTVKVYRKLLRISQSYYNEGLERAQVRDLSGAIIVLKKSLEFNKKNSDARNLLALIYYEMGETVEALSQWVISKNLDPEDNEADYFLEKTQENPTEFESLGQAIKKYNLALSEAKQGHVDLAVIQLRKAISLNPNFIKAIQLLSLLYIQNGDYSKAEKLIAKGLKVDVSNTTLLRYLSEINPSAGADNGGKYFQEDENEENGKKGNGVFATFSYKEDKPSIMPYVNLIIGVLIGALVVYYLIVPTVKKDIREEYESQKVDYSSELASKQAQLTQKDKTISSLNRTISELEDEVEKNKTKKKENKDKTANYSDYFAVVEKYDKIKSGNYDDEERNELAMMLWRIDESFITEEYAIKKLDSMRKEIYDLSAKSVYKEGRSLYDDGNYEAAEPYMLAAADMDPDYDTALYYVGKVKQALGKMDEAIEAYQHMLEVCPNSTLKEYIPQRLKECGYNE